MNYNNGLRSQGVVIPVGQRRPQASGAPRSVTGLIEMRMYMVQYADDDGVIHEDSLLLAGGQWYKSPNGENFIASLQPISPTSWLGKAAEERRHADTPGALPKQDAVDVLGG